MVDIFCRQVTLQMCRSYAGQETCTRRQVCAPLPPAYKSYRHKIYSFSRAVSILQDLTSFVFLCYLIAEKWRVKLWKKFENRKIGKVWGPISRLRERNCKNPTTKFLKFYPWTTGIAHNLSIYSSFSKSFGKSQHHLKNWKIWRAPWDPLLRTRPQHFSHLGDSEVSNDGKNLGDLDPKFG